MRTIFVGAVGSSRIALSTLLEVGEPPLAVVTLPLELANRHSDFEDLRPICESAGVPVIETSNVNDLETLAAIRALEVDVAFVIGWSQLCGSEFLGIPSIGSVGFHPSRLPENRGRAVIPWTILQGLDETGSTLFWLDEHVDSGDVLVQQVFPVAERETATTLYEKHLSALAQMLRTVLPDLVAGRAPRTHQDADRASFCARRVAEDGLIDWRLPAREVDRLIRAVTRPYPGAFTWLQPSTMVHVWESELVGSRPYWGLPGQVQHLGPDGALVQCGDREHVLLRSLDVSGSGPQAPKDVLRLHERFLIRPA